VVVLYAKEEIKELGSSAGIPGRTKPTHHIDKCAWKLARMANGGSRARLLRGVVAGLLLVKGVSSADILQTTGFSSCNGNASVTVQRVNISYNNDNKTVSFDVAGSSSQVQNVTAILNVTAYGQQIYSNAFDPCSPATFVQQLCPGMCPCSLTR